MGTACAAAAHGKCLLRAVCGCGIEDNRQIVIGVERQFTESHCSICERARGIGLETWRQQEERNPHDVGVQMPVWRPGAAARSALLTRQCGVAQRQRPVTQHGGAQCQLVGRTVGSNKNNMAREQPIRRVALPTVATVPQ